MTDSDLVWEAIEPPESEEDEELFPEDDEPEDPYYEFEESDWWTEQSYLEDE